MFSVQIKDDHAFMKEALVLAEKAGFAGEVPIGAVVVSASGEVLGRGWNQVEANRCQDQHAEMCAIREACKKVKNWRLDECTIYVTLEPCVMCIGCIALSRITRLVYGADSPEYGYKGRREDMCRLYSKSICNVTGGLDSEDSELLLQSFFQKKR